MINNHTGDEPASQDPSGSTPDTKASQGDAYATDRHVRSDDVPTARYETLGDVWRISMDDADHTQPLSDDASKTDPEEGAARSRMVRSEEPGVETIGTSDSFGTDPRDPLIGAQIQNYAIDGLLGEGGFGNVYHAVDEKLGREVALKFLRNPMNEKHRSLFEREAKAIARLSKHAHIVDIFAWGEFNNMNYFILEFVPMNLAAHIKANKNGIPVPDALTIIRQCAEALAFAHDEGIVHRDIKPANILLEGPAGPAKITDFGLTRLMDSTETSLLGGGISGSPPYMSPEQACGEELDNRTDIFSLGVTLYELLCGRRPFEGKTPTEVIEKVRGNNSVHISERRGDLPAAVVQVIDRALAYNKDQRYQSAHEMVRDLGAAVDSLDAHLEPTIATPDSASYGSAAAQPATGKPRKGMVFAGAAALVAALVIAAWTILFSQGEPRQGVLAEAHGYLSSGNVAEAAPLYEKAVTESPSDEAWYGTGYARLLQDDYDGAAEAFNQIAGAARKNEGLAAVAYARNGAGAQADVAGLASNGGTPYLLALNGMIARDRAAYGDAVSALAGAPEANFDFTWQKTKALQALGQAYLELNELEKAEQVFAALQSGAPQNTELADAYLDMIRDQRNALESAETQALVKDVARLVQDGGQTAAASDTWTSKPLTFFFLDVEDASPLAIEKGYTDLLPRETGAILARDHGITRVDRSTINEILQELQLTQLNPDEASRLGRFLGAQFFVKLAFLPLSGQTYPEVSIVDVATSEEHPVDMDAIAAHNAADFKAYARELADKIWGVVESEYPIQGRLTAKDNQAVLNVGTNHGVTPGMRFDVGTVANNGFMAYPGSYVEVKEVGDGEAVVELGGDGFTLDKVNGNEMFVREAAINS